jgi:hypothetical protein
LPDREHESVLVEDRSCQPTDARICNSGVPDSNDPTEDVTYPPSTSSSTPLVSLAADLFKKATKP